MKIALESSLKSVAKTHVGGYVVSDAARVSTRGVPERFKVFGAYHGPW